MTPALLIVVSIAVAVLLGNLGYRYLSRRRQLLCPTWLAWGLDNPVSIWLYGPIDPRSPRPSAGPASPRGRTGAEKSIASCVIATMIASGDRD